MPPTGETHGTDRTLGKDSCLSRGSRDSFWVLCLESLPAGETHGKDRRDGCRRLCGQGRQGRGGNTIFTAQYRRNKWVKGFIGEIARGAVARTPEKNDVETAKIWHVIGECLGGWTQRSSTFSTCVRERCTPLGPYRMPMPRVLGWC